MRALTYTRYGPPEVVGVSEVPRPEPNRDEVIVRVVSSAVNTGDWRIRAAAFPGILAIPGRLMFGIFRPRNTRLGSEFAGIVEETGSGVTRFEPGQAVYGLLSSGGAAAEFVAIPETGAISRMPHAIGFDEAAALPFGGLCALVFLTEFASLQEGQRVLIIGASGGVGCYAVQIAKACGAHVTGVSGPDSQNFVAGLGADETIDYKATDIAGIGRQYDVVFDTIGALSPAQSRRLLRPGGLFLPLNFGLRELAATALNAWRSRKIRLAVNPDRAEDLARLTEMVEGGRLRPVIDTRYPLEEAARAHAHVEARHRMGAVVLSIAEPD